RYRILCGIPLLQPSKQAPGSGCHLYGDPVTGALEEFSVAFFNSYSGYLVSEVGGDAHDFAKCSAVGILEGPAEESSDLFKCYRHDFAPKNVVGVTPTLESLSRVLRWRLERVTPGTSHASVSLL